MIGIQDWLDQRGVEILVVSFAKPEQLVRYQDRLRWPLRILADPERTLHQQLMLKRLPWHRLVNFRSLKVYWRLLRQGHLSIGYQGDDIFQSGGDFLIDSTGRLLYAHRSHDPADRPTTEQLQRAIDEV